ncbi:hypothetical protein AXX12_17255 [Anaerosporomusa subterranea]|uniref:Uncharacterized protein n=1 Tax=Anaerosporomusa subterranea TaxID=1794912 RepID=A0A154BV50_ANASB|nr:pyridoxamine 5'-phosphate oxidase family protein [Anaerosporomusa subterranea]KYZ77809.1 hypothetical protein AXX12_17255 [Anaerosporomusa subterranea]
MYEREVIALLEGQVVFVATVSGIAPQVRPMRAQLDEDGAVWLYCSACRRADEIAINDQAALCIVDDDGALLRMNGQLEPISAQMSFDRGLCGSAAYRLRIHSILFNPPGGGTYTQVECPQDLDGILLQPESSLSLQRR